MRYDNKDTSGKRSQLPYPDETTYNKVRKHLSDFNDRITDEDIRNIKIAGAAEADRFETTETAIMQSGEVAIK